MNIIIVFYSTIETKDEFFLTSIGKAENLKEM